MKKIIIAFVIVGVLGYCLYAQPGPIQPIITNLTQFKNQTAWRLFYSNTDGDVTELALGASGYLKTNGTTSAPTWSSPTGAGDLLADGSIPLTANWDVGNFDITLKSLTGDGTIEGATITEGGNAVYSSGETPSGELGGTYANITIDDNVSVSGWTLVSPTFTTGITATDLIDSAHYVAGSIDAEHLAADIIDETKIADNGIDSEHYNDGSIDAVHLAADVIDETKIADNGIDSEHYNDGSIDLVHLASAAYAKDIVTTAPITGATDNVLVGADGDVTLALDFTTNWDFSGADLELPQASPGVPDADGEIEVDFTDGKVVIQHGSAHAELGASTDVVVGTLIKSWSATIFEPDGVNDVLPVKAINSIEFPHGVVITAIYLGISSDTNYVLTVQNFDDFDTINGANGTIDTVTYTADTTGEIIDSTPTYATIAAGQIIMVSIPATDVAWIHFEIYYYEPAA